MKLYGLFVRVHVDTLYDVTSVAMGVSIQLIFPFNSLYWNELLQIEDLNGKTPLVTVSLFHCLSYCFAVGMNSNSRLGFGKNCH